MNIKDKVLVSRSFPEFVEGCRRLFPSTRSKKNGGEKKVAMGSKDRGSCSWFDEGAYLKVVISQDNVRENLQAS